MVRTTGKPSQRAPKPHGKLSKIGTRFVFLGLLAGGQNSFRRSFGFRGCVFHFSYLFLPVPEIGLRVCLLDRATFRRSEPRAVCFNPVSLARLRNLVLFCVRTLNKHRA